jgi:hypothetical protein
MAMLADTVDAVIGAGTHTDTHTACLLGRQLAVLTIRADPANCRKLLAWAKRNAPGPWLAWPSKAPVHTCWAKPGTCPRSAGDRGRTATAGQQATRWQVQLG